MRGVLAGVVLMTAIVVVGCGDDEAPTQLANPASEYCVAQGGRVDIEDGADGQIGICELPDGSRVEEWELFRRSTSTTSRGPDASESAGPCSGGDDAELPADPSLPAVVDQMRRDIGAAAATCDYPTLRELIDANGDGVRYTFGAPGDPIAAWREAEQTASVAPMRALRLLLDLPAGRSMGPDGVTYVWPAAFAVDHPTEDELREVAATGLYSMEQLQGWVDSGTNYLGYRIFITEDGDWTLFVDGD